MHMSALPVGTPMHQHVCMLGSHKRALDSPGTELQMVVSCQVQVLRTKPRYSGGAVSAPSHEAISPAQDLL